MLELIIFIIIIVAVSKKSKRKSDSSRKEVPHKPFIKKSTPAKRPSAQPIQKPEAAKEQELTYVQPSKAYRPPRNAAERHEEWMPVPDGKIVIRCNYCGAENLISKHSDPSRYTCYFCREEL